MIRRHLHRAFPLLFLLLSTWFSGVLAVAYIDDMGSNMTYMTTQYQRYSGTWVHDSSCNEATTTKSNVTCFNNTLSSIFNDDRLHQTASMFVRFRGTGITLYIFKASAANTSIAVDGEEPTIHFHDSIYAQRQFNYSFYDKQNLPYGQHNLSLFLHNVITTSPFDNSTSEHGSLFYFDYAAVNDEGGPSSDGGGSKSGSESVTRSQTSLMVLIGTACVVLLHFWLF